MKEEKKNISKKDKALTDKELSAVNGGAAGGLSSVTLPSAISIGEKAFGGASDGTIQGDTLAGDPNGVPSGNSKISPVTLSGGVPDTGTGDDGQGEKNEIHLPVMPLVY